MKSEKSNLIDMNKSDLKKLSKSQLIKLLLKQEKKKPKIIVVDDTKSNKPKKVYNHDNLFDDDPFPDFVVTNDPFEKMMIKVNNKDRDINEQSFNIDSRYQNLMSKQNDTVSTQKIRDYPMIKTSLSSLRKDELKRSTNKNKAKMSFIKLFENRLNQIQGDRETVSIILDVEINHTVTSDIITTISENVADVIDSGIEYGTKPYEIIPKLLSKNKMDEFGIKYKKVIKQTTYKGIEGVMGKNYIKKVMDHSQSKNQ